MSLKIGGKPSMKLWMSTVGCLAVAVFAGLFFSLYEENRPAEAVTSNTATISNISPSTITYNAQASSYTVNYTMTVSFSDLWSEINNYCDSYSTPGGRNGCKRQPVGASVEVNDARAQIMGGVSQLSIAQVSAISATPSTTLNVKITIPASSFVNGQNLTLPSATTYASITGYQSFTAHHTTAIAVLMVKAPEPPNSGEDSNPGSASGPANSGSTSQKTKTTRTATQPESDTDSEMLIPTELGEFGLDIAEDPDEEATNAPENLLTNLANISNSRVNWFIVMIIALAGLAIGVGLMLHGILHKATKKELAKKNRAARATKHRPNTAAKTTKATKSASAKASAKKSSGGKKTSTSASKNLTKPKTTRSSKK
jgi:hypothetical protein